MIKAADSLDNESSVPFVKAMERLLEANPSIQTLELDLSEIRYISSTGVGALASVYMSAQRHQTNFSIINPSKHVTTILSLLGFEIFLPIVRTGYPS